MLIITIFSCSKEKSSVENLKLNNIENNLDAKNLYEMYLAQDYPLAFIYDNNYGYKAQVKIMGEVPKDLICKVDNYIFKPNVAIDKIFTIDDNYENVYGKNITVELHDDEKSKLYNIYAPKVIRFQQIGNESSVINRINNNIRWDADDKSFGVLLKFSLYDKNKFNSDNVKTLDTGYELIEDDGSYNIDHLLQNTTAKSIEISLTRANGVTFKNKEDKNVFFYVQSVDSHYYIIE